MTPSICCPANATDELDGVTLTGHTPTCPNRNNDGPRWYAWQDFDEPARLEAGTLVDFARAWALKNYDTHVPGTVIEPIEVRTWDRIYRAEIVEQRVDAEEMFGTYLVRVEEESVVELIGVAEKTPTT